MLEDADIEHAEPELLHEADVRPCIAQFDVDDRRRIHIEDRNIYDSELARPAPSGPVLADQVWASRQSMADILEKHDVEAELALCCPSVGQHPDTCLEGGITRARDHEHVAIKARSERCRLGYLLLDGGDAKPLDVLDLRADSLSLASPVDVDAVLSLSAAAIPPGAWVPPFEAKRIEGDVFPFVLGLGARPLRGGGSRHGFSSRRRGPRGHGGARRLIGDERHSTRRRCYQNLRPNLVAALEADLVGPFDRAAPAEVLPLPPSRWYLTGFLAPQDQRDPVDPTADDDFSDAPDDDDEQSAAAEPEAKQKNFFPASLGLSVLLPKRAAEGEVVRATVRFADYVREERPGETPRKKVVVWRRVALPPFTVELPIEARAVEKGVALKDTPGVVVCGKLEDADAPGLPPGTRALALFVVNRRTAADAKHRDEQYLFQVELEVSFAGGLVPRPNRQGEEARDFDDRVADLQFRDHVEWAVGHGTSVEVVEPPTGTPVTTVRTTWIPRHEVRRVVTHEEARVTTAMEDLAELADGEAVRRSLGALTTAYAGWIAAQASSAVDSTRRAETQKALVKNAATAQKRIAEGVELLATSPEARLAFRWMNTAMAASARARSPQRYTDGRRPQWRLFQLAFVLLNLPSVVDEHHADRANVDLIFFPTGGGKTEAYLGVIAFTLLVRRMRGQARADKGLGVAVLLRYTLRLLTLDQLGRAATLVCALELLRREHTTELGDVRFSVGLWVGRSATANTMDQVKKAVVDFKNSAAKNPISPFPLSNCPWCGRRLGRDSLVIPKDGREEVIASCMSASGEPPSDCEFSPRKNPEGLPVLFVVDEPIYRELPAFLVAHGRQVRNAALEG